MSLENEFSFTPFTLPSLMDGNAHASSARTPSRQSKRVSRGSRVFESSTLRSREDNMTGKDGEEGEKVSPLDPRRLTPNLHATLVSEILNLRQEVQTKNKEVLRMEEALSAAKDENSNLDDQIAQHVKEERSVRRQMQLLETGTMSALDELAKERDSANENLVELKKRLEASQIKVKKQDDDTERTNSLWMRDQERWDIERRTLERKVHIVEGRLKLVLEEIEQSQQTGQVKRSIELIDRPQSRISRAGGARSAASTRRDSSASSEGTARNRLSHINGISPLANVGTLADELAFEEDDDTEGSLIDEPASPEALPEEQDAMRKIRPFSAQSHRQSVKAFKVLGLVGDDEDAVEHTGQNHVESGPYGSNFVSSTAASGSYRDDATQYSPPASPGIANLRMPHVLEPITEASSLFSLDNSTTELVYDDTRSQSSNSTSTASLQHEKEAMVSSAVQTVEQPLSPPDTPKQKSTSSAAPPIKVQMSTAATQTEDVVLQAPLKGAEVPVISIHPPSSSHSNHGSVVLPPHTKSVACQAMVTVPMRSVSMQTEGIRIDNRPVRLPAHLLPSAISSKPSSPVPERNKKQIVTPDDTDDDVVERSAPKYKRASRDHAESLSSKNRNNRATAANQTNQFDGDVSDDDLIPREPVKKILKRVENEWILTNIDDDDHTPGTAVVFGSGIQPAQERSSDPRKGPQAGKKRAGKGLQIDTAQAQDMRKTALVASGSAAHIQRRSRSPSLPTLPSTESSRINPPFPVPDRSSSRKFPWEGSDGMGSPSPLAISFFGQDQKDRKHKRPPIKKLGLRKSRSQAADLHSQRRPRSRSPTLPTSGSSYGDLESPRIDVPPLPNDEISSPFRIPQQKHLHKDSVANSSVSAATTESIHMVDAIAQTMIGEWMWKYVRRRKSFGLQSGDDFDARGRDADSMRHQRWVWLAPCERAVLWSSKQPVSSSALQGKLGQRKLEIQSVLDVRDDNPMPRGADPAQCFGRSILILTPQRALKFTAMSRERHYMWLSALSFLSQPGALPAEVGAIPPVPSHAEWLASPQPPKQRLPSNLLESRRGSAHSQAAPAPQAERSRRYQPPEQQALLRRHPIRDSIRVAKGKARPTFANGRRSHTTPAAATLSRSVNSSALQVFEDAVEEQREAAEEQDAGDSGCEAPHVPRTAAHTRKRSNTGPRTTTSFRSFASKQAAQSSSSAHASFVSSSSRAVHSDFGSGGAGVDGSTGGGSRFGSFRTNQSSSAFSPHWDDSGVPPLPALGSAASSLSAGTAGRMFGANGDVGTMRMDAFVEERIGGRGSSSGAGMKSASARGAASSKRPSVVTSTASSSPRDPLSASFLTGARTSRGKSYDPFAGF